MVVEEPEVRVARMAQQLRCLHVNLGPTPRADGRWFRLGDEMFRAFTSASISPLEVKCCASNHIHVSSQGRHILASANAAARVSVT